MIATLAQLKSHLGIPTSDTQDDAALTQLLTGLQARIEKHCNRKFDSAAAEEIHYMSPRPVRIIAVRRPPIVSGLIVEELSTVVGLTKRELSLYADYIYDHVTGHIRRPNGGRFTAPRYDITYTGGYSAETMPGDLFRAVLMQAAYEHRAGANLGLTSISAQGVSANLAPAKLLPEVQTIIDSYIIETT